MTIDAKYYTPKDIALLLKVGRSRAYQIARELPHLKLGKAVRVAEGDLQAWLAERVARPAQRAPAPAPFVATWPRKRRAKFGPVRSEREAKLLEDAPPIRVMMPRT